MKLIPSGIRRPLSHPDYRYFATGQIVSVFSFWMQSMIASWLVYSITGSGAMLGLVSFLSMFPALIFSPLGGVLADKFPKKYIIYVTQVMVIITSLVMGILIITDRVEIWHAMVSAFVIGAAMSMESPVRNSYLIELVGKEDLRSAIALNASIFNLGKVAGPALGGLLIPLIGIGPIYLLTAVGFSGISFALYKISVIGAPSKQEDALGHTMLDGFKFAIENKAIRYGLLLVGSVSMLLVPITVLLPRLAVEILSGSSVLLGALSSASGIGAFAAAIILASGLQSRIVKWVLVGDIFLLIGLIGVSFSRDSTLTLVLLLAVGGGSTLVMASINTLIQLSTPDYYRGRVMSIFSMTLMGVGVFGSIFAGYASDYFGILETFAICATLAVGSSLFLVPKLFKHSRKNKDL